MRISRIRLSDRVSSCSPTAAGSYPTAFAAAYRSSALPSALSGYVRRRRPRGPRVNLPHSTHFLSDSELRPLRSTIITRFNATTGRSATQGNPVYPSRASGWGLSPRRLELPVLTLPSFAHMPAPIPRCSCSVLSLLASQADGGLRLFRTGSAVTLPVSRLARRSIFILACVLVDPATAGPFPPEASCSAVASSSRSGYFRLEQQLPGGLSSSRWKSAFFPRRTRNLG